MPRTTVPDMPSLTGLVGWWRFRDSDFGTTTLTNEVSGGANFTISSPKWVSHGGANALEYNQTGQSVGSLTISASDLLDFSGATAITVLGKVCFAGSGGNGNGRLVGGPFVDHVLRTTSINSTLSTATTNVRWQPAAWSVGTNTHWIGYSYSASDSTTRLTVDGVEVATTTSNNAGNFSTGLTGAFKLGADQSVTSVPQGWIYEVAIFKNRRLTATEMDNFAKARRPA